MKKLGLTLLSALLYPVSCTAVAMGTFAIMEPEPEPVVGEAVSPSFPVLVLVRDEDDELLPFVVEHQELERFLSEHPRHAFLVPVGESERLSARLGASPMSGGRTAWSLGFTVEEDLGERQTIRADLSWDDDRVNVGWYEATAGGVRPLRHQSYFGPGVAMATLPVAVLVTTVLYLVAGWWLRARRRRGVGTGAAASS